MHAYAASSKFIEGIKEFGWENFTTEILEDNIQDEKFLSEREEFYIEKYDSVNNGYNILHNNFKNFYKKKYKFSYEQLYDLYIVQKLSTTEIADMYETDHVSVHYQLKKNGIPTRNRGSAASSEAFGFHTYPEDKRIKFLDSMRKKLKGNQNGLGNKGGIITSHNKHKNKYYHTLCEICQENIPEYIENSTWMKFDDLCEHMGIPKSSLIKILKSKNLYFTGKSVTTTQEMFDNHIVIKTGNLANRTMFLWNVDVVNKIVQND